MTANNVFFLENIEWFDETGVNLVKRFPESGSGEIKYGAQLTVRESQTAVFFYQGRAYDALPPGRHTLKTANLPILTKILSFPWGLQSPLRAEVYFLNMKVFTDLKWGTREPVAFKDSRLGLIRLRAFGIFDIRVLQPVLFLNTVVGTQGIYSTADIGEYLSRVIVSRFNDLLGAELDSIYSLPGRYDALAERLKAWLQQDFNRYGLGVFNIFINSITPPPEVQKAIDDKTRMTVFDDLNKLLQMKAAEAIADAAKTRGEPGSMLGMGVGMMMPAMFQNVFGKDRDNAGREGPACPGCKHPLPVDAAFCPACGRQIVVFSRCAKCNKDMPPDAKFCPSCGEASALKPAPKICRGCGAENLAESLYCNRCGEKL